MNSSDPLGGLTYLLVQYSPIALAYSGGLDSRFLAHMIQRFAENGVRAHLFHIQGPHVPQEETRSALEWATAEGQNSGLTLVQVNPLEIPDVRGNGKERCYHCKHHLFSTLLAAVEKHPFFAGQSATLCDGTNASDIEQYRPGLRALHELGVRSPLAEAGLTKDMIRELGAATGLDQPTQKARPCLLTRFAYGISPTREALAALDAAEQGITRLLAGGGRDVPDFRLRLVDAQPVTASLSFGSPLPFTVELHIADSLEESVMQNLEAIVTAQGLRAPRIVVMSKVSGHYDASGASGH